MPQDQLTQLLIQKQLGGGQPLPDTLTPEQEAAQSSAPLSFMRKPVEMGVDTILSSLGARGVQPGHPGTLIGGLGAAMAGAPGVGGKFGPLLEELFAKNPKALGVYESAMKPQLAEA